MSDFDYDVFISYRHAKPDADIAKELIAKLRSFGFRVFWDGDFRGNETFFAEMERGVRCSRFTLALLSKQYVSSGNTLEEAIMTRALDNTDRQRRLIPLYIEPCDTPLWLSHLVGIRLYDVDARPRPLERVFAILQEGADRLEIKQVDGPSFWRTHAPELVGIVGIAGAAYIALEAVREDIVGGAVDAVDQADAGGDAALGADDAGEGLLRTVTRFLDWLP